MNEIIVKGRALPVYFGMRAIAELSKTLGNDFASVASGQVTFGLEDIVSLLRVGLNEGARRSKSEMCYTDDEVWDIVDDDPSIILVVSDLFVEAVSPMTDKLGALTKNSNPTATRSKML